MSTCVLITISIFIRPNILIKSTSEILSHIDLIITQSENQTSAPTHQINNKQQSAIIRIVNTRSNDLSSRIN